MSEVERYEPRRAVRRAELRSFLLAVGPQDLKHLLAFAQSIDPATDEGWLHEQLTTRTALFEQLPDGRFRGRPDEAEVLVTRRQPRPRPRPRPAPRGTNDRWTPPPRPEPRGRAMDVDDEHGISRVEVADPGGWEESGRRITVALPLDGPAPEPVLQSIAAAARNSVAVEVFTAAADGAVVYRGSRRVISTEVDQAAGRTRVTFGSAADDVGRAYTRAVRMLEAGATGSTSLTPYRPETQRVTLSPKAARTARLPIPSKRSTGAYVTELSPRLASLQAGTLVWDDFVEWLVQTTRSVGKQDFEQLIHQLCVDDAVPKGSLLSLLVNQLEVTQVEDPNCARALLLVAAETPDRRAEFAQWAIDHHAPVALHVDNAPTSLTVAQLAVAAADHVLASERYAACVEELQDHLTRQDLDDWINSAILAGIREHLDVAADIVFQRAMLDASRATDDRDLLLTSVDMAQEHQLDSHELLIRAIQSFLALPELEREAIDWFKLYGEQSTPSQQLELLSLFETARKVPTIDWLLNTHLHRVGAQWHEATPRAKAEERSRLELIGGIVGRTGLSEHFPIDEQEQAGLVEEQEPSPLEQLRGLVVLLIGGNANTFRHVRDRLLSYEPDAVEHVEASWERNRTAQTLKPRLQHADVVIEATSQMKHQDTDVLKAALGSPPSARRIRAAGGPSAILHHVANALART